MSNEFGGPHEEPEDDDKHVHMHAVSLSDLFEASHAQRDQRQMVGSQIAARIDNFLDGLNVEQLMVLRIILGHGAEHLSLYSRIDGQAIALLRRVHHVDAETGLSVDDLGKQAPAKGEPQP